MDRNSHSPTAFFLTGVLEGVINSNERCHVALKKTRPVVVLIVACLCLSVVTMNMSFLNVGLPSISRELHASNTSLEWIVDGYALVFAGLLLAAGSLGDRLGPKQTLVIGLSVFVVGSVLSGMASTPSQLIAARCIMGAGAAGVTPMTLSVLTHVYTEPVGMRKAIGAWAGIASAAAVVAPVLAGALLAHYWWGILFWINVPLAGAMLLAVVLLVPKFPVQSGIRFDSVGALLSILFSIGVVASLIEGPQRGWADPWVIGGFVLSAVFLAVFIAWERRRTSPLIDLALFAVPKFAIGVIIVSTTYFFSFASGFISTQYLQEILGFSALKAGIALAPSAVVLTICAPIGVRGFTKFGPRVMIPFCISILTLSAVFLLFLRAPGAYGPLLFSLLAMGAGIGLVAAGTTTMVMSAVVPEKAGMASGAQTTTRQLGGAVGVAVAGSLIASRYAQSVTHSLHGTAAEPYTSTAQQSLASALTLKDASPAVQAQVAKVAQQAFVEGVHLAALVTVVLGIAVAVASFWVLSPKRAGGELDLNLADIEGESLSGAKPTSLLTDGSES